MLFISYIFINKLIINNKNDDKIWWANKNSYCLLVAFFLLEPVHWASQILLPFLDIVTNKSQPRSLGIATNYFIDQEKYFYIILFHMNTAIFIGILSYIAMTTLMIAYLQHTCGMFKIAWYALEESRKLNEIIFNDFK